VRLLDEYLRRALFLPEQASTLAREVDHLHYFVILTTFGASTAIGLTALLWFVRYRRRSEAQRTPRIESPWPFEVAIVAAPLFLFLVWLTIGFRQYVRMATPPPDALDVYVMGKQWMWKFAYPGGPSAIGVLYVPAGRPVRLLMTSRDVIHSFFLPEFRVKKDVVPGRYSQLWFEAARPGRYRIFCAEYCGASHSDMRGAVVALAPAAWAAWWASARAEGGRADAAPVDERAPSAAGPGDAGDSLARRGLRVAAEKGCLKCHSLDGAAHIGPTFLGLYGRTERLAGGDTVRVDEGYLTESMMEPRAKVVAGYRPVMPTFRGRLEAPEVAALLELIKSLGGAAPREEGPAYAPIGAPLR
jgi:cytochrome c oxidase subunit 2